MEDITELTDEFVRTSITSNMIFDINKQSIDVINVKSNKLFLGDRYKEFINAYVIDEDEKKACGIWKERYEWYVEKGIEIAQTLKENIWKTENPGSQSFGKFNPILEHPKLWYGDNYQSVEVGIKTPQYVSLVSCLRNIIPEDIIHVICDHWLEAEANLARNYLLSLNNPASSIKSSIKLPLKKVVVTVLG